MTDVNNEDEGDEDVDEGQSGALTKKNIGEEIEQTRGVAVGEGCTMDLTFLTTAHIENMQDKHLLFLSPRRAAPSMRDARTRSSPSRRICPHAHPIR